MLRVLFEYIVPMALPTAVYLLWLAWQRRRAAGAGTRVPDWQEGPWLWLIGAGLALTIAAMVATALYAGYAPGSHYVPAATKDGRIVPGHFEP